MTGGALPFLTCHLNSSFAEYLFSTIGSTSGVGTTRWLKFTIERLPAPRITPAQERESAVLLSALKTGTVTEADINHRIHTICDLVPAEIIFVENYSAGL
jgi:hypothetical protein